METCEYFFDGMVILGCVGEYVADYTNLRTEEWRHRIGRRSLLLLTLGIGLGLFSLIKTNGLSGQVIDSLGDKAQRATKSANTATETSGQAVIASSGALEKSAKAEASASNAVTVARDANRVANSFEKDIVTAKSQAADAESHLADALQRAAAATAELTRLKTQGLLLTQRRWLQL